MAVRHHAHVHDPGRALLRRQIGPQGDAGPGEVRAEAAAPWHLAESRYRGPQGPRELGDERTRALTLAAEARDALVDHPDPQAPERRAEIDAWLAAHRARGPTPPRR